MVRTFDDAVEWNPVLSPKGQAYAQELRSRIEPRIRLFVRIREALGMNQIEAARTLAITQSAFSKRENLPTKGLAAIARLAATRGAKVRLGLELADGSYVDLSDAIELID